MVYNWNYSVVLKNDDELRLLSVHTEEAIVNPKQHIEKIKIRVHALMDDFMRSADAYVYEELWEVVEDQIGKDYDHAPSMDCMKQDVGAYLEKQLSKFLATRWKLVNLEAAYNWRYFMYYLPFSFYEEVSTIETYLARFNEWIPEEPND